MASRRRRARWWLKWAGLVAVALIVAMWGVSLTSWALLHTGRWDLHLGAGGIIIRDRYFNTRSVHWGVSTNFMATWRERSGLYLPGVARTAPFGAWDIYLPCWWLVLMVGIPTAYLWWLDRRPPSGHCQKCGYDLTWNVSGVCPECGENVTLRETATG